jgi:hypothetical protein
VRHKLPLLCIISLNGGWTADPERNKPGRDLGYTRYDKMAEALGCYAEYVEEPEDIRPALQRAWKKVEEGMVGFVNVKTDYAPARRPCAFPAARPERPTVRTEGAPAGAPLLNARRRRDQRSSVSCSGATFQKSTRVFPVPPATTAWIERPPLLITMAFVTVPTALPRLIVIKPVQFELTS